MKSTDALASEAALQDSRNIHRPAGNLRMSTKRSLGLALTAALVTGVERLGMPLFYDIHSFHGAAEGADGDSDQFEALDFMVRVNCG